MERFKNWLIAACIIVIVSSISILSARVSRLKAERDRFSEDTKVLLDSVSFYRTQDSLSAAQVGVLRLTLDEYKKYRSEDAALIKTLQAKNRQLLSVNSAQAETIIELSSRPRDTVIIRDSVEVRAKAVHCGDEWYDFDGILTADEFTGKLSNRDAILITETVKYKRFLWWKCGVKDKKIDVVSKNPHTTIIGAEFIRIEEK